MDCFKCGKRLTPEEFIHEMMRNFIDDINTMEETARRTPLRAMLIQSALQIKTEENYGINRDKETCAVCGYNVGDALEIHHKDKNKENNKRTNLIALCRNCHYLVHRKIIDLNH